MSELSKIKTNILLLPSPVPKTPKPQNPKTPQQVLEIHKYTQFYNSINGRTKAR